MPKHIFEQTPVTLNGYDIACDVESLELMTGRRGMVDVTGLCSSYEEFLVPNLRHWGVRVNYFTNFDASSSGSSIVAGVITVLNTLYNSTLSSGVSLVIRASTGIRSAANPEWSGLVQIDGDYMQHAGAVSEADKGSVTLKGTGVLSFLTSSS